MARGLLGNTRAEPGYFGPGAEAREAAGCSLHPHLNPHPPPPGAEAREAAAEAVWRVVTGNPATAQAASAAGVMLPLSVLRRTAPSKRARHVVISPPSSIARHSSVLLSP